MNKIYLSIMLTFVTVASVAQNIGVFSFNDKSFAVNLDKLNSMNVVEISDSFKLDTVYVEKTDTVYETKIVENIVTIHDGKQQHDFVDLGLPSGTLWATTNIGANTPEEKGRFFAYGETYSKDKYDWTNYRYIDVEKAIKNAVLCEDLQHIRSHYELDFAHDMVLDSSNDAATVNWGDDWATPSAKQFKELMQFTTFTECDEGRTLTSTINGNQIFLPVTTGKSGNYMSSNTAYDYYCLQYRFELYVKITNALGGSSHCVDESIPFWGYNVRPVRK